jgi:hypothetical protein
MAKLTNTRGRDNKNLPPTANNKAKITDIINIEILVALESFFTDAFPTKFNNR